MTKRLATLALAAALGLAAGAQAAVIGFDSADQQGGALAVGDSVTAGGFNFTLTSVAPAVLFAGDLTGAYASNGSPSLFADGSAVIEITAVGGLRFNFGGFELGGGNLGDTTTWAAGVTLVADSGSGTVARSFAIDPGNMGLTAFNMVQGNLQKLTVIPVSFTADGVSYSLDNLNLSAVPEPSVWALSLLGLLALNGALRRRRAAD